MALTFSWEVISLKTKNEINTDGDTLNDAVVQTYWKCTGVDADGNEAYFLGDTRFSAANVPASSFVAFANLTEATVLTWIQSVVVGDHLEHLQGIIQERIDNASIQEPELPWAL
jgi:hypothetical protein